jgi:hypothetical protein
MDLNKAETVGAMLGRDFLTWLWYKSEKKDGFFRAGDGTDFIVYIAQKVTVESGEDDSRDKTVSSGMMSELREARLGLGSGKKVAQAMLRLEQDSNEWLVQVNADDFSLSGLRRPRWTLNWRRGMTRMPRFWKRCIWCRKCSIFWMNYLNSF